MNTMHIKALTLIFVIPTTLLGNQAPAPNFFSAPTVSMNQGEFTHLLTNPHQRRAKTTAHIIDLHQQFKDSLASNTVRADQIDSFLNALWQSSMNKEQILDAAKKVAHQLESLARKHPHNDLITHLNAAVKKHTNPTLPDLVALKRQYSRTTQNDYRAAQSVKKMLFHKPGTKLGFLGGASVLGTGIGLHMLKKHNASMEIMTLQHHVLRHKIMQEFGSASATKLKGILEGKAPRRKVSSQERVLIERYLKLDAEYRKNSKNLIKAAGGAAIGGIGTLAAALIYKNKTPLETIK
ncbi:MAG: hypothetical protein QG632_188 [Candidatus Dependentiae bacterium]|nr:hypothetical protein [Candidatus Dependentiae bacterium]